MEDAISKSLDFHLDNLIKDVSVNVSGSPVLFDSQGSSFLEDQEGINENFEGSESTENPVDACAKVDNGGILPYKVTHTSNIVSKGFISSPHDIEGAEKEKRDKSCVNVKELRADGESNKRKDVSLSQSMPIIHLNSGNECASISSTWPKCAKYQSLRNESQFLKCPHDSLESLGNVCPSRDFLTYEGGAEHPEPMTKELMSPVLNLLSKSAGSPISDKLCVTDSVPERKMTALENSAPYEDGQESRENNGIEEVLSQKVEIPRKCKEKLTLKMQQSISKYVEGSQWKEPFSKGEKDLPVTEILRPSKTYGFPEISKNSRTSIEKSPYSNDNGVQIQYKHEESLDEDHSEKLSDSHVAFETFHQILDNFQETNKNICVENDIGMVIKSTHEQFGVDCGQERILEPFASDNNATFHQENVDNECPGIVLQVNQTEMLKEFCSEPLEPNKANKALKNVVSKEQVIEKSLLCKEETAKVVGTLGDQGMPYCLSDGEEQGNYKTVSQNLNNQKISNDSFLSKGKISVADAAQTTAEDIPETVIGFQAKKEPKIESQNLVFTEHRLACAAKEHSSPLPTNCPTALLRSEDSLKVENLPNPRALEDNITVLRIQKRGEKNDITFEYRGQDVNEVRATMPAKHVVENTVSSFGPQDEVTSRKNDIIFEYRGQDVNEIRATMPAKHVVENTASSFRSQDEVASESYSNDQDAYNSKSFKTKNCNESQREFIGDAKHSDLLDKFDIPVSGSLHESNTHGAPTVYQESMHTKKSDDGGYRSQVTVVPVEVKLELSDQATQLEDHTVPQHSIHLDEDSTEICLYQPIVKESYSGTDGKCVHSPSKTSGKFQWKSVYEATYIRTTLTNDEVSGTETLQAHQFCQVVPHFQSHRPLRVGLSKKQKVRRLHERSASQ